MPPLLDPKPLAETLRGHRVRIEGKFVEIDGNEPCPAYHVHFCQLLPLP
jgi:hypothetical protein